METEVGDDRSVAAATAPASGFGRRIGRRWRLLVSALVFGALLLGTLRGQDDDFPFGPFRMYATRQSLDGNVSSYRIEAVTDAGNRMFVPGAAYGMRRAELEGQANRFVAHPGMLGELALAYEQRRPGSSPLVEIQLIRRRQRLHDGKPVGPTEDQVVASWSR